MRSLLDINVLIALIDESHHDGDIAHRWFAAESGGGWASCAITQNGAVRILSQPGYGNAVRTAEAVSLVTGASSMDSHEFWPCDISVLDADRVDRSRLLGPKQVTDVYLLALAVAHRGRFVTFDRHLALSCVRGATVDHLVML